MIAIVDGGALEQEFGLPEAEQITLRNSSDAYGAAGAAAAYCGLEYPEHPLPGYWAHGWLPVHYNIQPEIVVPQDAGGARDVQYWVGRKDQEAYLKRHQFQQVRAIGLPMVYVDPPQVQRLPGTLLVMPCHSLDYTTHDWKFAEYARQIQSIRDRFSRVVVCIHPSCYRRGYWVDDFRNLGFEIVVGALAQDRHALARIARLLSGFEYVTTNGMGSHLAYAAFWGARPSIFGNYVEYTADDYKTEPAYIQNPGLLDAVVEVTSERALRAAYPQLFVSPEEAPAALEWGRAELGWDCRLDPQQLRQEFGWDGTERPVAPTPPRRSPFDQVRDNLPDPVRHLGKLALRPSYRARHQELRRIGSLPVPTRFTTNLPGFEFTGLDPKAFVRDYSNWFDEEPFRFESGPQPYIIDASARDGLAVAAIKRRHPSARILAVEPDAVLQRLLVANVLSAGWSDVEIRPAMLWPMQLARSGFARHGDAGLRALGEDLEGPGRLQTLELAALIDRTVDLLRLDLEDGEVPAFCESSPVLASVQRLAIDYYSTVYDPQALGQLIHCLNEAGFRVQVHTEYAAPQPFRACPPDFRGMQMRLALFALRYER